ncbi:MAG: sporulation peptidase YabG [Bacilli bacterium]
MDYKKGDYVTRNSYNNDTLFKIIDIKNNNYILKGVNVRLIADSSKEDLRLYEGEEKKTNDDEYADKIKSMTIRNDNFFYIPGKILHFDGDRDYLDRCINLYKKLNIVAYGVCLKEIDFYKEIGKYLNMIKPEILVITGHDAYYKKGKNNRKVDAYKNSSNFIKAVLEARKYERSHNKLIIISGACQSNYEELLKAGANFASSPKRINIHSLDPALIASSVSLSEKNKDIDLLNIIALTLNKEKGFGGVKTSGTMYLGYPRS